MDFPNKPDEDGIGQSKYCIPQPFSRCFISLCRSLFDLFLFLIDSVHFGDVNPRGGGGTLLH